MSSDMKYNLVFLQFNILLDENVYVMYANAKICNEERLLLLVVHWFYNDFNFFFLEAKGKKEKTTIYNLP